MIGGLPRQSLQRLLWPQEEATPGSLWAVLDCARDWRLYHALLFSRLDHQCLYSGRLSPEMKLVAPYMVELSPRYAFTRTVLEHGFGQSWGIFVRIDDWTGLRHHLRKLLTVRDAAGRKLLFRWYDPRVLRSYLPTCTPAELGQVFGPIDSFYAEAAGPEPAVHRYRFDGARLRTQTVGVETSNEEASRC